MQVCLDFVYQHNPLDVIARSSVWFHSHYDFGHYVENCQVTIGKLIECKFSSARFKYVIVKILTVKF
ncbi:hypothetical protein MBAV_002112 [Candidatus Magnetobacterium bavaricum]|uniref:Uncharacterized protein n=1 Tax=Candidatus Magnetobacterium bavaricum TaxID=29290 RepID=A0A0F3GUR2_9BACT|nr:hypothetical protein MBAV_002112 [Candidatus Magnetobacterium bavaricum]